MRFRFLASVVLLLSFWILASCTTSSNSGRRRRHRHPVRRHPGKHGRSPPSAWILAPASSQPMAPRWRPRTRLPRSFWRRQVMRFSSPTPSRTAFPALIAGDGSVTAGSVISTAGTDANSNPIGSQPGRHVHGFRRQVPVRGEPGIERCLGVFLSLRHNSDFRGFGANRHQPGVCSGHARRQVSLRVNQTNGTVSAYAVDGAGALTTVPGSPYTVGTAPSAAISLPAAISSTWPIPALTISRPLRCATTPPPVA